MESIKAIEIRKSCRCYLEQKVEEEKLQILLAAANNAPKAGELKITVIENKAVLKEINDKTLSTMQNGDDQFRKSRAALPGYQPLYGAPLLILLSTLPENPYGMATASCAATNITIAATELDLGSCFVASPIPTICTDPELLEKAKIPQDFLPVCGVLLGYCGGEKFTMARNTANNINYCK